MCSAKIDLGGGGGVLCVDIYVFKGDVSTTATTIYIYNV